LRYRATLYKNIDDYDQVSASVRDQGRLAATPIKPAGWEPWRSFETMTPQPCVSNRSRREDAAG
jgi:hypothetical protein